MTTIITTGELTITVIALAVTIEDKKGNKLEITDTSFETLIEQLELIYKIKNL